LKDDFLQVALLSGTVPGRGEGVAGEVDAEIEHDANGLPFIRGKALHGLLLESWLVLAAHFPELQKVGVRVFGKPANTREGTLLRIGDALLPAGVRAVVNYALRRRTDRLVPEQILRALTYVRWQTAQSRETGTAEDTTLRTVRVLIPGLQFRAPLTWLDEPSPDDQKCLALAVLGVRQLGTGRNRGFGYVRLELNGDGHKTRLLAGAGEVVA
jgi:hypothetical protein